MKSSSRVQLDLVVLKRDGEKGVLRTAVNIPAKKLRQFNAIEDVNAQYAALRDYINSEYEVDCLEVVNAMCVDTLW